MAETAKWYVIHTYSGYEAMVKDTLEKMVENSNLQEQILEIKILNQNIELNKIDRLYKNNIDCSNLRKNEQIISYNLVEGRENYKISTNIQIFKNNTLIKDNYQDATNLITRLT